MSLNLLLVVLILFCQPSIAHSLGTLPKAINTQHVKQFYETQVKQNLETGRIGGTEPHGTSPIDLEKRKWTEWAGEVETATPP